MKIRNRPIQVFIKPQKLRPPGNTIQIHHIGALRLLIRAYHILLRIRHIRIPIPHEKTMDVYLFFRGLKAAEISCINKSRTIDKFWLPFKNHLRQIFTVRKSLGHDNLTIRSKSNLPQRRATGERVHPHHRRINIKLLQPRIRTNTDIPHIF